jgi:hypothetical protein
MEEGEVRTQFKLVERRIGFDRPREKSRSATMMTVAGRYTHPNHRCSNQGFLVHNEPVSPLFIAIAITIYCKEK